MEMVGSNVVANTIFMLFLPIAPIVALANFEASPRIFFTVLFVLGPAIYMAAAILLVALANRLAAFVSRVLGAVLDKVAWQQIRSSAYGNDTQGENALSAASIPAFASQKPALPEALENEISQVADAAAYSSLSKLRSSIHRLAFAEDDRSQSDLVSEYLTWDELIHTAYFKVPRFNKLVSYAIASSEGFKPTPQFLADPDFALVKSWYDELSKPVLPAPSVS